MFQVLSFWFIFGVPSLVVLVVSLFVASRLATGRRRRGGET
jgi:hypothetical protein